MLRKAIHRLGLRYRLYADLPGKPDILFKKSQLAVFVDGAFWHGHNFRMLAPQLHVRRGFWLAKIAANVARDKRNTRELRRLGYQVLRFWDHEVLRAPEQCAKAVFRAHSVRVAKLESSSRRRSARAEARN
jgi:DNA mismatch endonuclease (patch repair protein)